MRTCKSECKAAHALVPGLLLGQMDRLQAQSRMLPDGEMSVADDTWQKQPDAPQREAYQQAEVRIALAKHSSEVMTPGQMAEAVVEQILQQVTELVRKDEDLCGKKAVYMKFGCRGDWPDLQPPDENASVHGTSPSTS